MTQSRLVGRHLGCYAFTWFSTAQRFCPKIASNANSDNSSLKLNGVKEFFCNRWMKKRWMTRALQLREEVCTTLRCPPVHLFLFLGSFSATQTSTNICKDMRNESFYESNNLTSTKFRFAVKPVHKTDWNLRNNKEKQCLVYWFPS